VTLVIVFAILGTSGCDIKTQSGMSRSNKIDPKVGVHRTVQFRRDALGAGANLPIEPTTNSINGAKVNISGKISKLGDDWIVLTEANSGELRYSGELWIPRSVILLIKVSG